MWKSERTARWTRTAPVVGSRRVGTNLGVPALTGPLQQTSLNVATKFRSPELTQLAVADSKEKKKFRAFSGDPVMWSCVLANDVAALLNGGNFVESESQ